MTIIDILDIEDTLDRLELKYINEARQHYENENVSGLNDCKFNIKHIYNLKSKLNNFVDKLIEKGVKENDDIA